MNVWVATAKPFSTSTGYSAPSTANVTVPGTSVGVTVAVSVACSPTLATVGATSRSVSVAMLPTVTVSVSELVV